MAKNSIYLNMRVIHRYLGFFLAGVMAVYAISGLTLILRDSNLLKKEKTITKQLKRNIEPKKLGKLLDLRRLKIVKEEGDKIYFQNGFYNKNTGVAEYKVKTLPFILRKMAHFHKAKSGDPLFFFNIFFGLSLLFFVVSAFWMYTPKTSIFRKGMLFTIGGIILTLALLFI